MPPRRWRQGWSGRVAEVLAADVTGTSITAVYDTGTGVLTLSGSDTVANYQQVLRTITYNNTSENPTTTARIITYVANDGTANGDNTSPVATATVSMTAVNDAPMFTTLPNSVSTSFFAGGNGLLSIGSGDFDGDGDVDLVTGDLLGDIRIATNDGTGIFTDAGLILDTAGEIESVKVVDIDGDSDLDIIAVTYDVFNTNPAVHVLTNDGTGNFTVVSMETTFQGADDIAFGDLDNDGDIDIAATFWTRGRSSPSTRRPERSRSKSRT